MAGLLEGKVSLVTGAASGIGRAASLVMDMTASMPGIPAMRRHSVSCTALPRG